MNNQSDENTNGVSQLAKRQNALKLTGGVTALVVGLFLMRTAQAVSFIPTGSMTCARESHTATRLPNGLVLLTGGVGDTNNLSSAELYDPTSGTWTATGSMSAVRYQHTATLLPNGKVLVTGGQSQTSIASAEVYDPATGTWTPTGPMSRPRIYHTATVLPNGKVLVAGGYDGTNYLSSAELYDPATGTWTMTGSLTDARSYHTATLLPSGRVLVAAGDDSADILSSAELYDPASGIWTVTGPMTYGRSGHTATLLPNGNVLVAAGFEGTATGSDAEVYDPASGMWSTTGNLTDSRTVHTATLLTNGLVLVTGGEFSDIFVGRYSLSSAELYDPATGKWTAAAELKIPRDGHTATLLANGQVLIAGGEKIARPSIYSLSSAELYDPTPGTWVPTAEMTTQRSGHTATLLGEGQVLVAGGFDVSGQKEISAAELYDPGSGKWTATGPLLAARGNHTDTLLNNGKILICGGWYTNHVLSSAELYDPTAGTWASTGSLNTAREWHTATLLPNGQVLVAAGYDGNTSLSSAELYDPVTGTWTPTGDLNVPRNSHSATLLPNGLVLVVGGADANGSPLADGEVFNSTTGTWTPTASLKRLNTARWGHTATLLPGGKVLVAAGYDGSISLSSAELYDLTTGSWTPGGDLNFARSWHTATLLPNGQVLIAGGEIDTATLQGGFSFSVLPSAELYDATTGTWVLTGEMNSAREVHTATLLPNGKVLAAGGGFALGTTANFSAELFDNHNAPGPLPAPPKHVNSGFMAGGSFQFAFTSSPNALFNVFATTDLTSSNNWVVLGGVVEFSPGWFQFTDQKAASYPNRFYRVRSQ
jgi:N-acetylneuraminic acid mutarotase